jgi:hypothetical protein
MIIKKTDIRVFQQKQFPCVAFSDIMISDGMPVIRLNFDPTNMGNLNAEKYLVGLKNV